MAACRRTVRLTDRAYAFALSSCCSVQVAELASEVAGTKSKYDDHEARLKERLDRLKVRESGPGRDCVSSTHEK